MKPLLSKLAVLFLLLASGLFLSSQFTSATIISKSNSSNSLKNGLVGWWTFDGVNVTSTGAIDSSGNGNSGTRTGTKVTTGKIGQALSFNGSNGFVSSTHSTSLNITGNITISAWVKPNAAAMAGYPMIVTKGAVNTGYLLFLNSGLLTFRLTFSPDRNVTTNIRLTTSTWNYITAVYDGTLAKVYVNGVFNNSASYAGVTLDSNTNSLGIGGRESNFLDGALDDVRIYNRALSGAEIAQLYTMGGGKINKTTTVRPALLNGLVSWWTFDGKDMTANTSTDKSGNGNDGTRTGTKVVVGKIGQALSFNGTGDYVTTTLTGFPTATADVTVSFWAKPQNTITDQSFILMAKTDDTSNRLSITFPYANVIYWDFGNSNNTGRLNVTMDASWYNKMAYWTFTSQTGVGQKIYRNGVIIASDGDVSTFTKGSKSLNIGSPIGNPWKGILDDLRIYSRALAPAEIAQLYKMGGGKINKSDLVRAQLRSGLNIFLPLEAKDINNNTTTNRSANAYDGLKSSGVTRAVGKIGQGMKFDGTANGVILFADNPLAEPSSSLSISIWLKRGGGVGNRQIFLGKGDGQTDATTQYWVEIEDITNDLRFYLSTGSGTGNTLTATDKIITDTTKWHHVVVTWENNLMKLYLDGSPSAVTTATSGMINDTVRQLGFGRLGDFGALYYTGLMDDIRLYNRALSAAEVNELYRMGK